MNLKLLLIFVLIAQINHHAQTQRHSLLQNLQVTNLDKKRIVSTILRSKDNDGTFFDHDDINETAFVSTKNLPYMLLKNTLGKSKAGNEFSITFISSSEIANKTDTKFNYLEFSSFEMRGKQIKVVAEWYFGGTKREVYTYDFIKIENRWKGRLTDFYKIPFDEAPPARPGITPSIELPTDNNPPPQIKKP